MRRPEKQKKFHEAVLRTLYPSPSPLDSHDEDEEEGTNKPIIKTDYFRESSSLTDDDDDGGGSEVEIQKLSRAKRKRLRKKKLKEDALRRGDIVGPLLPLSEPSGVRENAADNYVVSSDQLDSEQGGCSRKKKLKQRRSAKRLAKEGLKSSEAEDTDKYRT